MSISLALAGRQTFNQFEDVIRLRRIHRQKGVGEFKDSTMRLRDVANRVEDYDLWKTHELDDLDPNSQCSWPEGESLLDEGLVLVPENGPAGKINGARLARRARLGQIGEPASGSSEKHYRQMRSSPRWWARGP